MKNFILITFILTGISLSSCDKCQCTAREADGSPLYEIVRQDICQDQLRNEGDYCDCDCD